MRYHCPYNRIDNGIIFTVKNKFRLDYILGYSNDGTPFNLTDEEIDQLGRREVEEQFKEILMAYISLDEFGRTAVENTIRTERQRCVKQQSLLPTDDIVVKLQILAENK